MSMPSGIMVTLRSAQVTGTDQYGNDVYSFVETQVGPCAFVPGVSTEAIEGAEQVIADAEIYLPAGTVITPEDQIIVNGTTYQVTGRTSAWQSPFSGVRSPVRARLRIVTGAAAHSAATGGND